MTDWDLPDIIEDGMEGWGVLAEANQLLRFKYFIYG